MRLGDDIYAPVNSGILDWGNGFSLRRRQGIAEQVLEQTLMEFKSKYIFHKIYLYNVVCQMWAILLISQCVLLNDGSCNIPAVSNLELVTTQIVFCPE